MSASTGMNWCHVDSCRFSDKHSTQNHQCGNCGKLGHGRLECGNPDKIRALKEAPEYVEITKSEYAIIEGRKLMGSTQGKIFACVYAGMGCQWFVKRDSPYSFLDTFFMHTDSWGQYGPQGDDTKKLQVFLCGYVNVVNGNPFVLPKQ
jgi:hypothetical protein